MRVHDFIEEYENLSDERKNEGLKNLMDQAQINGRHEFINQVLELAAELEAQDGFGTEGAEI